MAGETDHKQVGERAGSEGIETLTHAKRKGPEAAQARAEAEGGTDANRSQTIVSEHGA